MRKSFFVVLLLIIPIKLFSFEYDFNNRKVIDYYMNEYVSSTADSYLVVPVKYVFNDSDKIIYVNHYPLQYKIFWNVNNYDYEILQPIKAEYKYINFTNGKSYYFINNSDNWSFEKPCKEIIDIAMQRILNDYLEIEIINYKSVFTKYVNENGYFYAMSGNNNKLIVFDDNNDIMYVFDNIKRGYYISFNKIDLFINKAYQYIMNGKLKVIF